MLQYVELEAQAQRELIANTLYRSLARSLTRRMLHHLCYIILGAKITRLPFSLIIHD